METPENGQVEQPVEQTKTEETPLTDDQQQEQVQKLLSEEPPQEEETEVPQEEPQEETTEKPLVVTDEMIQKYPRLKMYRGKPIEDLAPVYDGLVLRMNQLAQEKKELEKKLQKDELGLLGDMPDPVDDPPGYKKWLDNRDNIIRQQVLAEAPPPPQTDYMVVIQQSLPEGVSAHKIAEEWTKYHSEELFNEFGEIRPELQKLYSENPQLLVSNIVRHYELMSKAQQNEATIEKKGKEQAYSLAKYSFREAKRTKAESSQINAVPRTTELTPEDEILTKIYDSIPK